MIAGEIPRCLASLLQVRRTDMRNQFGCPLLIMALLLSSAIRGQDVSERSAELSNTTPGQMKLPAGVLLVKGAWSSVSDSVTPVPEGGSVNGAVFSDPYFGMTYALPDGWTERYKGPPPSDSGRYVLAEISPANTSKAPVRGNILITAQDMFFTTMPASSAAELIHYIEDNLQSDYKVQMPPGEIQIADHSFTFFAYWSPLAQLHWYVMTTVVRCHAVQIVLTSRDTKLLESLMTDMDKMKLLPRADPAGGAGEIPVCIPDYARDQNMITRVNPVFVEHRFNPVPVRIIINKEGKVRHIHFLSAFADQTKPITDALAQWRFRPYRRGGQPVEVETGILFGPARDRHPGRSGS